MRIGGNWRQAKAAVRLRMGSVAALSPAAFAIALSTACRALFALAFAAILVSRFPPQLSVELFQILLLQTIFVTFVSGSGYGRAVSAGETSGGVDGLVRGYLLFAAATVAILIALEAVIVPRALVDRFVSPDRWKTYALIAGGVATGLYGILQGAIVKQAGPQRVFLPVAGVSLVFCAILGGFAFVPMPSGALLLVYVAYQMVTLLVFTLANRAAVMPLLGKAVRRGTASPFAASADAFGFGGVNTAALMLFFLFRQLWSEQVDPRVAEAAFFAVRISETYLGVLFYLAASSSMFDALRHEVVVRRAALIRAALVTLIALAGLSLATYAVIGLQPLVPLLVLCIALQLLSDGLRVPGSLATLFELQYGTAWRFALVALPAIVISAFVALQLTPVWGLFSFYAFQLLMSAGQIGAAIVNRAVLERRRRA